jgi:hypothetical protein
MSISDFKKRNNTKKNKIDDWHKYERNYFFHLNSIRKLFLLFNISYFCCISDLETRNSVSIVQMSLMEFIFWLNLVKQYGWNFLEKIPQKILKYVFFYKRRKRSHFFVRNLPTIRREMSITHGWLKLITPHFYNL